MRKLYRCILFIIAACAILLLNACSEKNSGATDIYPSQDEFVTPEDKKEYIDIVRKGDTEWTIVYPENCESYVTYAAELLANRIKILYDIDILVSPISDELSSKCIVVGKVQNSEVISVFEKMKYYDYGVTFLDGSIVISAYSSDRYLKAVDQFAKCLLKIENENEITLSAPKDGFMYSTKDDYDVSSWKICGTDLSKYRIVYESSLDVQLVKHFRDNIAKICGSYLDVVSDAHSSAYEHEILVGNTNRPESTLGEKPLPLHFNAKVINNKLVIRSGGNHSLPKIFESLFILLTDKKDNIAMDENFFADGNIFDDPLDSSYAEGTDIRIMSCNILAELLTWSGDPEYEKDFLPVEIREEIFFAALDYYKPTIVGLQELTANWYDAIENNYHDNEKWELLKFENPNRNDGEYVFSTVMFRSDLYELRDCGMDFYSKHNNARARCYTWAILSDRKSGKEFCVLSTHWDGTGRENGFLQASELAEVVNVFQKRCPVFTTGDFNANENSNEFKQYLDDCDITDAKYSALLQVNNVGSWHNLTKDNLSWGSCDHITSTKESTVLKFQTLYENEIIWGSDHCWLIADIKLGTVISN